MTWHKFHAKPQKVDGLHFASKKEAAYYGDLKLAKQSGELLFFLRQVRMPINDDEVYVCDFLEFWKDGSVRFVDTKGYRTDAYKRKKRLIEERYPIEILEA